ncbi:MAG: hypothetical protein D6806_14630, partial [Deltaproteobacteria bacterium]
MRRRVALILAAALALAGPTAQPAPVELLEQDSQAFLQADGAMDVIYTLKFRELESRSSIRKIGQFYEPVVFTRAWIRGAGREAPVSLENLGDGYYRAEFPDLTTRSGEVYSLVLHMRIHRRFADPTTTSSGKKMLAVWFNPVRWGLPVGKSVIHLVLPLELPKRLDRPEDITPAMVDGLGVVTDENVLTRQDKWAWVYTEYRGEKRLTLYAEKRSLPATAEHMVRVYIPASVMPALSSSKTTPGAPRKPIERFEPKPRREQPEHTLSFSWRRFVEELPGQVPSILFWSFILNGPILLGFFVLFGWILWIVDRIAGTKLVREVFLPSGRFRWLSPTKGTLFGWTGLLVPFRL